MIHNFNGVSTFGGIVVKGVGSFAFWYRRGFPDSFMLLEAVGWEKIGY